MQTIAEMLGFRNFPLELLEAANRILHGGFNELYSIDFNLDEVKPRYKADLVKAAENIETYKFAITFPETIINFSHFHVVSQRLLKLKTFWEHCKMDWMTHFKCKTSMIFMKDR